MVIALLCSCSPRKKAIRHLQKAEKHIQKAKELDPDVLPENTSDTITIFRTDTTYLSRPLDTVWVFAPRDTIIQTIHNGDTIFIEKKGDHIGVRGVVQERVITDTVDRIITKKEYIPKSIPPSLWQALKMTYWLLFVGIGIGLATAIYLKK